MALPLEYVNTPNGSFLVLSTDTILPQCLKRFGGFEMHLGQLAVEVLRRRGSPGLLVDIGAHIGTFSVPVSLATGCRVFAADAQRVIAQILGANFVLNGIDRATIHNVILAGPGHPVSAPVPGVDYGASGNFGALSIDPGLFEQMSLARMSATAAAEMVEVRTLDDFSLRDVALIKVDVEGQELEVLRGALRTLEANQYPPLLFEAWRDDWWAARKRELLEFVAQLGYEITALDENFFGQHRQSRNRVPLEAARAIA